MMDWRNARILVTGGTGSFGNFVVRRLLLLNATEVRVMSRDEKKQYDMRTFYRDRTDLSFVVGDIRDRNALDAAMEGIDVVIQAAALKQVPTCERFPMEAVKTNTLGVSNVVDAALAHRVSRLVCISTDKAVKPVNVMGMTKALQERIVLGANLSRANKGTRLSCVRYGNVLRSRGSVIPFFRDMIGKRRPLPITDERMCRFLLTLGDAIDLVVYAVENMDGGEVFVRKSPAAQIVDLGRILCSQAGVPFEFELIGSFPGEKIAEALVSEEEAERTQDCGDYYRVLPWWSEQRPAALDGDYSSIHALVGTDRVERIVERADREFEDMQLPVGEFAKF
jgi:UDP-glucose 4-epimerase